LGITKLEQLYFQRWTIEEAFLEYIKRNFNFGISELKSAIAIRKSIYCQVIIMKFTNLSGADLGRKKLMRKNKSCKRNDIKDNRIILDRSTITRGLFLDHLLFIIFNGIVSRRAIDNFNTLDYIVSWITTNKGKHVPHICKTPYFKWYVQEQHISKKNLDMKKEIAERDMAKRVAKKMMEEE
jgi:hypothetical protein